MPPFAHKVFGIGLSKTGTKSLAQALHVLGLHSAHFPPAPRLEIALQRFQGLTDITVAARYKELDQRFPGAKFVLTVRALEPWQTSAMHHFSGRAAVEDWLHALRVELYGSPLWNLDTFTAGYLAHNARVRAHFANRPGDLLEMDISAGEGWEKLCPFLGVPIPTQPFPHLNQRGSET